MDVAPSMPPLAEDVPLVLPSTVMQIHYSPCQGFQNIDFIHYATLNLLSCLSKYDYRNGQWTSRNCLGIALDNPSSKSKIGPRCENCTSCARKLSHHKNSQIEKSSTLQLRDNIHSWWSNNGSFDDGTVIGRRCHALAEMDTVKLPLSSKSFIPSLMMKNDPSLMENLKIRDKIRNTLISKVFHARTECEFKIYKQNNTDRGADQQGQCTLREFLKVIAGTGVYGEKSEGAEGPTEEECKEDRQYIDEQDLHGRRAKVAKHMENRDGIRKLIFN